MSKINLLLTEANGNLSNQKKMIINATKAAEEYAFPKLKIDWDIDILVTNRITMTIPENGAGGILFPPILFKLVSITKSYRKSYFRKYRT